MDLIAFNCYPIAMFLAAPGGPSTTSLSYIQQRPLTMQWMWLFVPSVHCGVRHLVQPMQGLHSQPREGRRVSGTA